MITDDPLFEQLVEAVKATPAYDDLSLSDKGVEAVADALYLHQMWLSSRNLDRQQSNKKEQRRQIEALRNTMEDAADRIEALLASPALCRRVLSAYKKPEVHMYADVLVHGHLYEYQFDALENPSLGGHLLSYSGQPEGQFYGKVLMNGRFYEYQFDAAAAHPESSLGALIESHQRLTGFVEALKEVYLEDAPCSKPGYHNKEPAQRRVVQGIATVLDQYTGNNKSLAADYIRDFLEVIGTKLKHKTILNLLSKTQVHPKLTFLK